MFGFSYLIEYSEAAVFWIAGASHSLFRMSHKKGIIVILPG